MPFLGMQPGEEKVAWQEGDRILTAPTYDLPFREFKARLDYWKGQMKIGISAYAYGEEAKQRAVAKLEQDYKDRIAHYYRWNQQRRQVV